MLGGIKGDVIDIGVLRTTVFEIGDWVAGDLYNGRIVRLANSAVFKEPRDGQPMSHVGHASALWASMRPVVGATWANWLFSRESNWTAFWRRELEPHSRLGLDS